MAIMRYGVLYGPPQNRKHKPFQRPSISQEKSIGKQEVEVIVVSLEEENKPILESLKEEDKEVQEDDTVELLIPSRPKKDKKNKYPKEE